MNDTPIVHAWDEKQLRDMFAMAALQGLLLANQRGRVKRHVAAAAYKVADAMLKERAKQ